MEDVDGAKNRFCKTAVSFCGGVTMILGQHWSCQGF